MQTEFEAEAAKQVVAYSSDTLPALTVDDLYRIQREKLREGERTFRKEYIAGFKGDPVQLAERYRTRLQRSLEEARARAIVHDFQYEQWLLNYIVSSGQGTVGDRDRALAALARARVKVLQEMIADDEALALETASQQQLSSIPSLSEHTNAYLARRTIQSVVRDFIALVGGDKPVTAYNKADAVTFVDSLLCLPANWRKDKKLSNPLARRVAQHAKRAENPLIEVNHALHKVRHKRHGPSDTNVARRVPIPEPNNL